MTFQRKHIWDRVKPKSIMPAIGWLGIAGEAASGITSTRIQQGQLEQMDKMKHIEDLYNRPIQTPQIRNISPEELAQHRERVTEDFTSKIRPHGQQRLFQPQLRKIEARNILR